MQFQKWQKAPCLFPRKTFNIMVIQVYAPTSNAEEAEVEQFYEDLQDLLELTRLFRTNTQKRCSFHYRGLKCKSRKSRDPRSKVRPWSVKWSKTKPNRVLPREHTGHSKHSFPSTLHFVLKGQTCVTLHMDITRQPIPKSDWLYSL